MSGQWKSLPPPDSFHLEAAEGWLELGNPGEANLELDLIASKLREHPHVLEMRWKVYSQAKKWELAAEAARALADVMPDHPHGWIHWAFSLHELKRTREAWDILVPMAERFHAECTIAYNLACYACQLGNLKASLTWFGRALKLGGKKAVRSMALADADLKPLWKEIRKL
ncbi:MAG TPA: tetratricopeptide repeat protein [Verrucomicrobiae bacterium]|nr:tetratricopeptide repeat protein [Verrucomicrobiae bacterium]